MADFDLTIDAKGISMLDQHHTLEDTASSSATLLESAGATARDNRAGYLSPHG